MLPEIHASSEPYGEASGPLAGLPVAAALGDQQAALFGQTCFAAGEGKCTYGTGSFLLLNTGERLVQSTHGLLTTVGCRIAGRAGDLRPRGVDRGHRRAGAVAPRQARPDLDRRGDRDPGPDRRRQRRRLRGARLLGPLRAPLALRRAGRDRRAHRLHHQGAPGPRGAGGHRLADARGPGGDEQRLRHRPAGAQGGRRDDRRQPADAAARRLHRGPGGAADRRRDRLPGRRLRRRAGGRLLARLRRACGPTGTRPRSGSPAWSPRPGSAATGSGRRRSPAPWSGWTTTTTEICASSSWRRIGPTGRSPLPAECEAA